MSTQDTRLPGVTGAAPGVGRATAPGLAAARHDLAPIDVDGHGMEATAQAAKGTGCRAFAYRADVCDTIQVGDVARQISVEGGTPALLVNVAGVAVAATVLETSDEEWSRVLGVNLTGPFQMIRAFLPLMLDRGAGGIVNVASVAANVGIPRRAA